MFWKQFQKKESKAGEQPESKQKLPKPQQLPQPVGAYLVVEMKNNPDWVWKLKCVIRPKLEKGQFDVRVFDEAALSKVSVRDYTSLDDHQELILYEGWYDNNSLVAKLEGKKIS